jgi:MFS family permease
VTDPLKPPPRWYRWLVLVLISLAMFGNYYVYDCISPLADVLQKQLGFTDSDIGMLNAIYSIPNVFMVLLGGLLIDRIGTRKGTMLFGLLCFVGAVVTALSPQLWVMATGRLIFGIGAESLIVAVTTAIAKWFKGKELSFAFGVNLTLARLGSFAALNSPSWARPSFASWQEPLLISVGFGTMCIVGALFYWLLEARAEKSYSLGEGATDKVVLKDLFNFGVSYWFIVALCVTFYAGIFPFQTFAVKFLQHVYGVSRGSAGFLSSVLTLFAMVATPLFGAMVDRVGKRAFFMMLGSLLLIPVYLMMAYKVDLLSPLGITGMFNLEAGWLDMHISVPAFLMVPVGMMGIAFSLIPGVMWPSVAYVVDASKLGTAYGLMTMIQNIGLAGFNLMIGWANDAAGASETNPGGYTTGMWIFSVLGFLGLLFAFLLRRNESGPKAHGLETITASSKGTQ